MLHIGSPVMGIWQSQIHMPYLPRSIKQMLDRIARSPPGIEKWAV
jgi:hypothetical protein